MENIVELVKLILMEKEKISYTKVILIWLCGISWIMAYKLDAVLEFILRLQGL